MASLYKQPNVGETASVGTSGDGGGGGGGGIKIYRGSEGSGGAPKRDTTLPNYLDINSMTE